MKGTAPVKSLIEVFVGLAKIFCSLIPLKGKKPAISGWQMWCEHPRDFNPKEFKGRNCGIPCGPANGIIVVDVDDVPAFEAMRWDKGWDLPITRIHETGSGKPHYFFRYPQDGQRYGCRSIKSEDGKRSVFDIRGIGGQVVAPGSVHPATGKRYMVAEDRPIAEAPHWLLDFALQPDPPNPAKAHNRPTVDWDGDLNTLPINSDAREFIEKGAPKGKRSEAIMSVVNSLVNAGLSDEAIIGVFEQHSIGEKYREKGATREKWLAAHIKKAREAPGCVLELNKKHAVILNMGAGQCTIMNEKVNPATGRPDLDFSHLADFRIRYANRKVEANGNMVPVAKLWVESPYRREYDGIVFAPGREVPGHYNLWTGFAVEPRQGDWSKLRDHILEVICSGNRDHFDYLFAWMARIVQDPGGERPGVAVVLRGERGCGKGTFASTYGKLFGVHFLPIQNQALFHGRFNAHFKNCILAFIDEAIWAGDKASEGMVKALITETTITCEAKFKDPIVLENHTNFIIASNNDWVVPAGFKERRFFVLDVPGIRTGDHAYFEAIHTEMQNGGLEAMFYDLLHHDLSGVNLRKVPKTEALLDQIEMAMTPAQKFWLACLRHESGPKIEEWGKEVESLDLYARFLDFAKELSLPYPPPQNQLMKELKRMCPSLKRKRTRSEDGRVQVVALPSREVCQMEFANFTGQVIDWDSGFSSEVAQDTDF